MIKYLVFDPITGNGIADFDTLRDAAMFQYERGIYLTTGIYEISSAGEKRIV